MDIRLHHLSIGYRRGPVVARDINITILGGRLTCLIGDNGIGKSTLLRTLSGFQPKVGGEIWYQFYQNGSDKKNRLMNIAIDKWFVLP